MAENETVKKINEELLDAFTSWYNKVASEVTSSMNYTFSRPFIGGVCDNFGAGKKNIIIVGQEARGLNDYGKSLKEYQMWSIGFMSKQLGCKKYLKNQTYSKVNSPFWRFVCGFTDYSIYWTNIDKLHLISKGKTKQLKDECEKVLNKKYLNDKSSIFEREIEIINPAVIIFLTGPHYYKTMEYALGTSFDDKPMLTKNQSKLIVNITDKLKKYSSVESAFWTYHPNFLNRRKGTNNKNEIENEIDYIKINIDTKK